MPNFKKQLIRLGSEHPELQNHIAAILDRVANTPTLLFEGMGVGDIEWEMGGAFDLLTDFEQTGRNTYRFTTSHNRNDYTIEMHWDPRSPERITLHGVLADGRLTKPVAYSGSGARDSESYAAQLKKLGEKLLRHMEDAAGSGDQGQLDLQGKTFRLDSKTQARVVKVRQSRNKIEGKLEMKGRGIPGFEDTEAEFVLSLAPNKRPELLLWVGLEHKPVRGRALLQSLDQGSFEKALKEAFSAAWAASDYQKRKWEDSHERRDR